MLEQVDILKKTIKRLEKLEIEYMVSGSVAMNFYAQPRMTRDIDIVIIVEEDKADMIVDQFKDEFYIEAETVKKEILQKGMFNVIHTGSIIKIDFVISQQKDIDKMAFMRKRKARIDEFTFHIISPEDLVINKLIWAQQSGSELQKKDIRNLVRLTEGIDMKYIHDWVLLLELEKTFQDALA